MRFLAPGWLWLLCLLPILYLILVWRQKRVVSKFTAFVGKDVWSKIAPELDWRARVRKGVVWILAMAFLVLAMARPQWGKHEESVKVSGLDVMIALDVSNSMYVEDVVPSRITKAKHLIRSLVGRLDGDRVGVVAFAGSAYVACPLTTDLDYVLETIEMLGPAMVANQGTDIGIALETAAKALARGAEEAALPDPSTEAGDSPSSRVVILISDGESHEGKATQSAQILADSGAGLYVLGIGTEKGGPIPVRDQTGLLTGYRKNRSGGAVVSVFKPDALMELASIANGKYWNVTNDEAELDELLLKIGVLNRADYTERRYTVYEERFYIPLFISILLILLELSIPVRRLATIVLIVVIPLSAYLASAKAAYAGLESYLENERALKAYKDGDLETAKKKFGLAQALDPSRPELQMNQGIVQMREGNVDGAIQKFLEAAKEARKSGDKGLASKSYFNLGAALGQKGELGDSVRAYLNAIDQAKELKDEAIEADARKNIELLIVQKKQKDQEKQNNNSDKESEESDEKLDKAGKDRKDQHKIYKMKKRKFKSDKMSKEDAERVIAELFNKERELQARLKKQRGKERLPEKDW